MSSQRIDRVNALLLREISTILQRDFEFKGSLVTVSEVETTPDMREAKVFISVLGGNYKIALEKIRNKRAFIQSKIAKRVVLRNTPILDFRYDGSASRGVSMVNLLDEVEELPKAPVEDIDDSKSSED
ncbi:30S ribosome-binding factor RbfA [Persicirhabdus sediminis]|uniref:Ribosome-binding factor A n=1 Tax=Persicirhabdus sediminis TaxID=454144 RepID=A0A8J7MEC7_9BACT|nr:30S ribosome-binding factor RbfA [Persicirhabdus sediminis]MBK1791837.1 30S ribosome-binding factor RbfA [Persicirhabdus sediminis]